MRSIVAAAVACFSLAGLSTAADVHASIKKDISIPAGGLGPALRTFSEAQHIHVVFISEDVSALHTRGASGSLTVDEALIEILKGTGLTYRYIDDETVSIVPVAAQPKAKLQTDRAMELVRSPVHALADSVGDGVSPAPTNGTTGSSPAPWRRLRLAQVDTPSDGVQSSTVQEVVVTGSRIVRSTFTTPTPVTVIGAQDIERFNLSNVNDVITQLPQNNNSISPANLQSGSFNNGVQLANLRGLNPFFGTRTLTLMNGQRVVPTTAGAGVDLTLIPLMAVGRVETVTGGASAVYGSDAIAGVVNIILDTGLEGFKGQVDSAATKYGDGESYHASAAYGVGFADGRGHFLIGGEWQHAQEIGVCSQARDWCAENNFLYTNTGYATPGAPGYGEPRYVIAPNATFANRSRTGVLIPVAPSGIPGQWVAPIGQMQFNDAGTALVPYELGTYLTSGFGGGTQRGGDPNSGGAYDGRTLRPDVRKYTAIARVDYALTDRITASLDGWYGDTVALNAVTFGATGPSPNQVTSFPTRRFFLNTPVTSYNPFLTPEQQAYVNSLGTGVALFGRNILNEYTSPHRTASDTWRMSAGLKGDLGGSWGWDAYAAYGETVTEERVYNDTIGPLLTYALDAVRNSAGQIVCGVTIPGQINPTTGLPYSAANIAQASLNGGCQPLNLFGVGRASAAALNYINQTLYEDIAYDQAVVAGVIHGDLFGGWGAGPIKFAGGAEYRRESVDVTHNLENQPWYKLYTLTYGLDFKGSVDVMEGYAEFNVPVIKDLPLFQYLEIDGAIRQTRNKAHNETDDYPAAFATDTPLQAGQSRNRDFLTWKISGTWDVNDMLRFRATRSRDVRAAQFRELFQVYAQSVGPFATVNNPWHAGALEPAPRIAGGSLDVKPEKSDTLTAGVVLQPTGVLDRLRLSADWFQIEINDPIVGPPVGIGGQNIVDGCFAGQTFFCTLVTRDAANNILLINDGSVNLGQFTTRGLDIEVAYTLPLVGGSAGVLSFRGLASYVYDMLVDTGRGGPIWNYAGQSGPYGSLNINPGPRWQGNAFATYSKGRFNGTVQLRYVGSGRFLTVTGGGGAPVEPGDAGYASTSPNSLSDNSVPSATYVNLSAAYDITKNVTLFGNITNLFNKEPPNAPSGGPTNPVHFDVYGMTWKVGARARF